MNLESTALNLPLSLWFITESDFVITIKLVENTVDGAANYKYRTYKVTDVNDGLLLDVDNDGIVTPSEIIDDIWGIYNRRYVSRP